ncbi:MAG: acetolactate synthase [Lachnospiraceae bacterium]|nr:acetolactate synthase [Lachnospiraceae bacterium]
MAIKQISVFLENKPGTLLEMTGVLAKENIDMRALSLSETKDFGIARFIADDVYKAASVLKEAGFINSLTPVVGVEIPDDVGGLDKVLRVLNEAKINVEYMYAFLGGGTQEHAYFVFRVGKDKEKEAESALKAKGITVVTQDDISKV